MGDRVLDRGLSPGIARSAALPGRALRVVLLCALIASLRPDLAARAAAGAGQPVPGSGPVIDIDQATREATALLEQYLRIDTSNPPGDVTRAADLLASLFAREGLAAERLPSGPGRDNLIVRFPGKGLGKPLVLLHHMDVVPASAAEWTVPPFSGELRDGVIWGRGALDDKGHGVMMLYALVGLRRAGFVPSRDILYVATADEEIGGGGGAGWLTEKHWDLLDPAFVINEGGVGTLDRFAPGSKAFLVAVAEKQILWLRLTAKGEAGHGSLPNRNNANDTLVRALDRITSKEAPYRATPVVREMFARLAPQAAFPASFGMRNAGWLIALPGGGSLFAETNSVRALLHDTISLTMLSSGFKANVIPSRAEATLDCRLLPDTDPDRFIAELRNTIADERISFDTLQAPEPAPASSQDTVLYRAIESAIHGIEPDAVVAPFLTTGATDSRFFRRRGVPAYGFNAALLHEADTKLVHGVDERVSVDNLRRGIDALARIIVVMSAEDERQRSTDSPQERR